MREIKFRVYNPKFKMMSELFYLSDLYLGKTKGADFTASIWMQSTNLFDKNGKEIYEGDLVRVQSQYETDEPIDSAPNKVYFRDGAFRCGFHDMILGEKVCTGSKGNWNMEVIGNIYENPELEKE